MVSTVTQLQSKIASDEALNIKRYRICRYADGGHITRTATPSTTLGQVFKLASHYRLANRKQSRNCGPIN